MNDSVSHLWSARARRTRRALSGDLLRGVRYDHGGAITESLLMRSKPGIARLVEVHHQLSELRRLSAIELG